MSKMRQALLERKQKLLNSLQYIEGRIKEVQEKPKIDYESDSSDSDFDLTKIIDLGPSITTLKQKQSDCKICQQATMELTSIQVLDSEITLQVQEPKINGDPVTEPGNWYEVIAECRLDLVPFLITFLVHKSSRKFGPVHYRNLRVNSVKKAHEVELTPALEGLTRPADAVEFIRQYAEEHRSRRTTLARLADTFGGAISMAAVPDGGYILKCLDMLEIMWLIKFSKSRARFNHAMKFDIDHLDENYIMVIKNAYQQLNHTATTEKRTLLLADIIRTCIEASGRTDFGETTTDQSDHEVVERYTKPTENIPEKVVSDNEIMAPPKSIPKTNKTQNCNSATKRNANDIVEAPSKKSKKDSTVERDTKSEDTNKEVTKKSLTEKKKISPNNNKNVKSAEQIHKTTEQNNETEDLPKKKAKNSTEQTRKADQNTKNIPPDNSNVNQNVLEKKKKKSTTTDQNKNADEKAAPEKKSLNEKKKVSPINNNKNVKTAESLKTSEQNNKADNLKKKAQHTSKKSIEAQKRKADESEKPDQNTKHSDPANSDANQNIPEKKKKKSSSTNVIQVDEKKNRDQNAIPDNIKGKQNVLDKKKKQTSSVNPTQVDQNKKLDPIKKSVPDALASDKKKNPSISVNPKKVDENLKSVIPEHSKEKQSVPEKKDKQSSTTKVIQANPNKPNQNTKSVIPETLKKHIDPDKTNSKVSSMAVAQSKKPDQIKKKNILIKEKQTVAEKTKKNVSPAGQKESNKSDKENINIKNNKVQKQTTDAKISTKNSTKTVSKIPKFISSNSIASSTASTVKITSKKQITNK